MAIFEQIFLEFSQELLRSVKKRYKKLEPGFPAIERVLFSNENYSKVLVKKPNFHHILPNPEDPDFPKIAAKRCAKYVYEKKLREQYWVPNKAGDHIKRATFKQAESWVNRDISSPVLHLLITKKRVRFSEKEIISTLNDYLKMWKTEDVKFKVFIPIFNFKSELKKIYLGNGVYIRGISDKEKTSFWDSSSLLRDNIDVWEFAKTSHAFMFEDDNTRRPLTNKREVKVDCAITALRLITKGDFFINGVFSFPNLIGMMGGSVSWGKDILPRHSFRMQKGYEFKRAELSRFKAIFNKLTENEFLIWNKLKLSLDRFNLSCQRTGLEDKIIDMVICLESSLLYRVRNELQYRLGIRASHLCSFYNNPKSTFDLLACLYKIRSAIVHEGERFGGTAISKLLKGDRESEFLDKIGDLVRTILQEIIKRLHQAPNLESVCEELDSSVISSLKYK